MTQNEFKSWFSGFCECLTGIPTAKQWARIKSRVSEINDVPTTRTVYVERYNYPWWNKEFYGSVSGSAGSISRYQNNSLESTKHYCSSTNLDCVGINSTEILGKVNFEQQHFDADQAFRALGKAEFGAVQ